MGNIVASLDIGSETLKLITADVTKNITIWNTTKIDVSVQNQA